MKLMKFFCLLALLVVVAGCGNSTNYWKEQMKSPDPVARLHAVHALRERVKEPAVVPVLAEALKDEDTFIRRDAARALGKFGPTAKEAAPNLQAALKDREPSVRKAASESLKKIDAAP
jgi:HEAT repeat protein